MAVNDATLIDAGVRVGLLNSEDVQQLRLQAKRERLGLVEAATRAGRFPEAALYRALADVRRMRYLKPEELQADQEVLGMAPRKIWQGRLVLPLRDKAGERILAIADPDDRLSVERAERATGLTFETALVDPDTLRKAIASQLGLVGNGGALASPSLDAVSERDPVRLMDDVMKEAYLRRASDIHLEPQEAGMRIRLRVDGHLQDYPAVLSASDEEALVNRVKVLANLDIAEQRMAQDGAMKYTVMNWGIPESDIRVATIPTRWGERCTLRILGEDTGQFSLGDLGMSTAMRQRFGRAITLPHGMILVTGPTGSGKSTTLYAAIRELAIHELNVLTVEDPVEQTLAGITQVQVSNKVGFAQALRSFLRHDPDVILVGEIRDRETADIALRAAMTGHLVMSTLHTNDSVGAVTRLVDIGAQRFLIGSTLIGVLAQRLGRRLCKHCRVKRPALSEELKLLGLPEGESLEIYEPGGCSFCMGTGFVGRIGFFEGLWVDEDLRTAIAEGANERAIRQQAKEFKTLWSDCCEKVIQGDVALSEIMHFKPGGAAQL
ncbi:GspE/PulE family protein [Cerasicoccus frondis]|uniref:GspE/PulE family protein n=1 Tax=Cerasicoccus frondis TaxID=490090 RepID=UPI0028525181|nr:GspE/PulE family protein [Cerasicoccus frondis]